MFSFKGPVLHPLWHLTCGVVAATAFSAACTTDADPGDGDPMGSGGDGAGGTANAGGAMSSAGAISTAGAAGAGGAAAPAAAAFRCESTQFPKATAAGSNPALQDFETGTLVLVAADTGLPIVNVAFTGEASGGTYAYQDPLDPGVVRTAALVEDRNGGLALSVILSNSTTFGGGMGIFFFPCSDASAYNGITFWARGSLPERTLEDATVVPAGTVTLRLGDAQAEATSLDTIACAMTPPADATLCTRPETTFVVGDAWAQFTFMWDDFDPGNKQGIPIVPTGDNLLGFDLSMDNAFGTPNDLELVIDDVAFVP